MEWIIEAAPVGSAEARAALLAYYTDIVGRYHGRPARRDEVAAAMAAEPSDDLVPPGGVFLLGRRGGEVGGCAGVRLVEPETAELTRVHVRSPWRGTGGGSALVAAAEAAAARLGARTIRLDTRSDLVEARALYAGRGYREVEPFCSGPYSDHWFVKEL
ncbi:GNAT family N-acetyltransferase [Streptomyces alkaliterrae]|uniref:GNAT family N-acetyltransferase n=1 Tax=Streptomyces alkaliterrae TaxID=2213162 RepID=A0A5P0YNA9_9ACTN|nr:GNAT family N-acetyltransferase [Streptomyces alkaliterrae]MBB1252823.1 GNAT family N-acetyltransferase [Streptomyces alkaliterrae]MBB1258623.1 GNAT family N-acetyltransferase [Streptomyces alkaliterrae]MQS01786.1 GNAT family N-acetyltransferase [Streptomyces alkaliterrae]